MDYFALYDLPESFLPDLDALRTAYHRLSRQTHPDFFADAPPAEQQAALERATHNTDAYATLSDYDRRLAYLLRQHGRLGTGGEAPALAPEFLLAVMDLNEQVMDLEATPDATAAAQAAAAVTTLADDLEAGIAPTLAAYPTLSGAAREAALDRVLAYYLRRRYVVRLREQVARVLDAPQP